MAWDKKDLTQFLDESANIGRIGDEGTFGTYGVAKPWNSISRSRRQKPLVQDRITFLYFIKSSALGLVKIGHTYDLNKRKADLQVGSADQLSFLGAVLFEDKERAEAAEIQMHNQFQMFHSHGEWFHPDPVLMEFIQSVAKMEYRDDGPAKKKNRSRFEKTTWPCGHPVKGYQSACTRCLLYK